MIARAILKNGGLFIPNVEAALHSEREVRVRFEILEQHAEEDIFKKTAGLLKGKDVDPLRFQDAQRDEWK